MNTIGIELANWSYQRLKRNKLYLCIGLTKMLKTEYIIIIFYANTHPHIIRPVNQVINF